MNVSRRRLSTPIAAGMRQPIRDSAGPQNGCELHVEERRWWDFWEPVRRLCRGVRKNLFTQVGISAAIDGVVDVSSVTR